MQHPQLSCRNTAGETPEGPTELEAMEQAASLRSQAEEMRRQEANHADSVILVSQPLHHLLCMLCLASPSASAADSTAGMEVFPARLSHEYVGDSEPASTGQS